MLKNNLFYGLNPNMQCIFLSLLICFRGFIQSDLCLPYSPGDSGYQPAVVFRKLSSWAQWSSVSVDFLLLNIIQILLLVLRKSCQTENTYRHFGQGKYELI